MKLPSPARAAIVVGVLGATGAVVFACRAVQVRVPQAVAPAPSAVASALFPDASTATFEGETSRAAAAGFAPGELRALASPGDGGVARAVLHTFPSDGCMRVALRSPGLANVTVRVAGIERWEPEILPAQAVLSGPLCGRAKDVVALELRGGGLVIMPYSLKDSPKP